MTNTELIKKLQQYDGDINSFEDNFIRISVFRNVDGN